VSADGLLAELEIPPEAVSSAYKQWLTIGTVADVAALAGAGVEWRRWPFAVVAATVGIALLLLLVTTAVRFGRLAIRLTSDGVEIDGVLRRRRIAWADVSGAGWLVIPQVAAYGRDMLFPVFTTTVTPLPVVIWVGRETLARASGEQSEATLRRFERGYARLGVRYVGRCPGMSPYLYSWLAAGCVSLAGIALYLLAHA
jgi:hypothetical protein